MPDPGDDLGEFLDAIGKMKIAPRSQIHGGSASQARGDPAVMRCLLPHARDAVDLAFGAWKRDHQDSSIHEPTSAYGTLSWLFRDSGLFSYENPDADPHGKG